MITVKSGTYYIQELNDKGSLGKSTSKILQNIEYIRNVLESSKVVEIPTSDLRESKRSIKNLLSFLGEAKRLEACNRQSKNIILRIFNKANCALGGQSSDRLYN